MSHEPTRRRRWGDPNWDMRRTVTLSVFVFCAFIVLFAFLWPVDKIRAIGDLIGSVAVIIMPVLIGYLGIAEAGSVIRDLKQVPGSTTTYQTTEIRETKKPIVEDEVRPPRGD